MKKADKTATTPTHPLAIWRGAQTPPQTMQDLATTLGVSRGYLAQIETFQARPGYGAASKIAAHTGITLDALMSVTLRHEKPTPKHAKKGAPRGRTPPARAAARKSKRAA